MPSKKLNRMLNMKLKKKLFLFPLIAVLFFLIFMAISYRVIDVQKEAKG